MLIRGRTSRLPGHNEVRYSRRCRKLPPRKAKATMNCRAPVACLVTVPRSRAWTQQPCRGGGPPPGPPPSSTGCLLSHSTCLVLGHSSRAGGGEPPQDPRPRARPLVLGHRCIYLFLTKSALSFATVSFREISSTAALMELLLPIEIHMAVCELQATYRPTVAGLLLLQNCVIQVSLLHGLWNSGAALAGDHRGSAIGFGKQYSK